MRRGVRGGSWNNNPQNLRSANRNRNRPDETNNNQGFRLASTPAILPEPSHSRMPGVCRGRPWTGSPGCTGGAAKELATVGRRRRR
ncbi:MAG: SUMF1/EgtB/PvdO family nonheme iron enzyme, partial [Methylococcus sp.]